MEEPSIINRAHWISLNNWLIHKYKMYSFIFNFVLICDILRKAQITTNPKDRSTYPMTNYLLHNQKRYALINFTTETIYV